MTDTKNTQSLPNKAETPALHKYMALFNESSGEDSFPEIECYLCSKVFSNVKEYEQHLNGKKHHQMLSKKKLIEKARPSNGEESNNIDPGSIDELHCDICNVTCSGYRSYTAHIQGSVHGKNVKQQKLRESLKDKPEVLTANSNGLESEDNLLQKTFAHCSTCDKVIYDPASYQKHMNGSTHKKKMLQQQTLDKLKNELQDDPQIEDEEFFSRCDICNKQFSGPLPFMTHLNSCVHENQVKQVQTRKKLKDFFLEDTISGKMICKECKKMFTDPFSFKLHLENNSHEKQKVKDKILEFVAANPEIVFMKYIENTPADDDNDEIVGYEKGGYFLVCKLCHTSFSGLENAEDHVLSTKHIKVKDEKQKLKLLKIRMMNEKGYKDGKDNKLK